MGGLCGPPAAICALRRSHFHDHTTNIDDIAFPRRLKLYVVVTFGLLLLYNPYAGLRRDARWLEVAIDSVEELGIGPLAARAHRAADAVHSKPIIAVSNRVIIKVVLEGAGTEAVDFKIAFLPRRASRERWVFFR